MDDLVWTTKDGTKIPVSKMETSHLKNAVRWARRRARYYVYWAEQAYAYSADAPDGAAMAAENEADRMMDQAATLSCWAVIFENELKRRGEQAY